MRNAMLLMLALGTFSACSANVDTTPQRSGLSIDQQDELVIRGTYTAADRELRFESRISGPMQNEIRLTIGDQRFDLSLDAPAGRIVMDSHGTALDQRSHAMLQDVVQALDGYLGESAANAAFHERGLYAAVITWQASGGLVVAHRVAYVEPLAADRWENVGRQAPTRTARTLNDDGIQCVKKGSWYNVSYDDNDESNHTEVVQANSYNCNGRCGAGCGGGQWTWDCLEHDECCRDNGGGTTCWNPVGQCGDEYSHAAPDYACTWCGCLG
jgi:hypothetical protein